MRRGRLLGAVVLAAATLSPGVAGNSARADDLCPSPTDAANTLAALPAGTSTCTTGARPGGRAQTPLGFCSLNFAFSGTDGNRYIGTAGHCVLKYENERRWAPGTGPWAKIDGKIAGHFVYATLGAAIDWGLIRLDPAFPWSAELFHFGGPTGMYTDRDPNPVVVHHFGHGIGIGNLGNSSSRGVGPMDVRPLPARSGLAMHTLGEQEVGFVGAAIFGDSGSAVISSDGRALGTLVRLISMPEGTTAATRIDYSVARAESVLGTRLTLLTAPMRPHL